MMAHEISENDTREKDKEPARPNDTQILPSRAESSERNPAGHPEAPPTESTDQAPRTTAPESPGNSKASDVELDDFGLPIRKREPRRVVSESRPEEATLGDIKGEKAPEKEGNGSEYPRVQARAVSVPIGSMDSAPTTIKEQPGIAPSQDPDKDESGVNHRALEGGVETSQTQNDAQNTESNISGKRMSANPGANVVSESSHHRLTAKEESNDEEDKETWKNMTALGPMDVYDDYGRMVARAAKEEEEAKAGYQAIGAAGKGYTRVHDDDDVESVTSMDEDTSYLFKEPQNNGIGVEDDLRDPISQLQATKDLLTEGQRIAYVGVTRLTIFQMVKEVESNEGTRSTKKLLTATADSLAKWGQQIMIRLYAHMEIDSAEQVMIEQLAEHGVQPSDLVPPLMHNARVKNPLGDDAESSAPRESTSSANPKDSHPTNASASSLDLSECSSPPPYEANTNGEVPDVQSPSQLPSTDKLDIDLRWTVLCDIFLVLIADSTYDARSRHLLERVGETMQVSWLQICRFEKRVTDSLEMQEEESKETWDESENMEKRRKTALKQRYMVMGLATVGGGLVIGLSAGLLAPVIGAGLAAGFTTIGVSGTGAFLGGAGGTALIASGATITGSTIGIRASDRRTGAVKTFEYRPLHNNKRVNLIVTVSGWMTGGIDDVRLPYSTIDPIMGDIYSVLWEPEMLKSMGATINILATEALTQGLQQVLGSTVLTALMASLQLPIILTKLSYLIDNPWNVSLARANAAGLILADSLIEKNLGNRPITLLGYSLGSRLIFSCLKELARKKAFGLVQNVFLFGSPIVAKKDEYLSARCVVSGRFVNGYASNDWILGYLFRATGGGIMTVSGLAPVEGVPGIENVDVTHLVNGHMAYRSEMPRLLREVGWQVESDEFVELEDPDPDNHQERQRELIREINEARKEAETKPDKKKFSFFKRNNPTEKKGWETYDIDEKDDQKKNPIDGDVDPRGNVIFDIDAIRAELESEHMQVKQLESTLPPMKLDLSPPPKDSTSATPSEGPADPKPHTNPETSHSASPGVSSPQEHPQATSTHNAHRREPSFQNDEIDMTFDTSYHVSPTRTPNQNLPEPSTVSPLSDDKSILPNLTHNAWVDDTNDEQGINMTFE